jgi:RNA polymerase sigma-70 factor (ECF subfamily)
MPTVRDQELKRQEEPEGEVPERRPVAASAGAGNGSPPGSRPDWSGLVGKIRAGDPSGMEELYRLFSRGIRFYLCRQLGPQELEDRVHDTFLIVVQAIRRGELREPERLMGFVRTVVRRQVAAHIDTAVQNRKEQAELQCGYGISDERNNPEEDAIARQRVEIMTRVLRNMSRRDREILTRFYLLGESQEQISSEMNLTGTQFRLLKSRAKARFGELGKRKLQKKSTGTVLPRAISA